MTLVKTSIVVFSASEVYTIGVFRSYTMPSELFPDSERCLDNATSKLPWYRKQYKLRATIAVFLSIEMIFCK